MRDEDAYMSWLQKGGAQTKEGRATRLQALRTIERNLESLGFQMRSLEEAWAADRFAALRDRIRRMRLDARMGGQDYRILMPQSVKPDNRLSSWGSWLAQYARFLDNAPPKVISDRDAIFAHVIDNHIQPARATGHDNVEVAVAEVCTALDLADSWSEVCDALSHPEFQTQARLSGIEKHGAGAETIFRLMLTRPLIDPVALETLRRRFLHHCPDFTSFAEPGTGWALREKAGKAEAVARIHRLLDDGVEGAALGKAALEIMRTTAKDGPLIRWQTPHRTGQEDPALLDALHAVVGALLRTTAPTAQAMLEGCAELATLRARGATALTQGERINIVSATLAMIRPQDMAPLKVSRINAVWQDLTGETLFDEARSDMAGDIDRLTAGFAALFDIMHDDWGWQPGDWLDLQGFLWIAGTRESASTPAGDLADPATEAEPRPEIRPVNLILYGPPGTGKTHATAAEALRLCGEPVPGSRAAVMTAYRRLVKAGRIEFVTFHPSTSYEDFVEGLRPVTGLQDSREAAVSPDDTAGHGHGQGPGFRLEAVPGVFRRIAQRAELDAWMDPEDPDAAFPGLFKISAGALDDPHRAAREARWLAEGLIEIHTTEAIDWSGAEFSNFEAIRARWHQDRPGASGNGFDASGIWSLRVDMQQGDLVLLFRGRDQVVAIGGVTGDYAFGGIAPDGRAVHRRKVVWEWQDPQGRPAQDFLHRPVAARLLHRIKPETVKTEGFDALFGPDAPGRGHVLIIDEINRANIAKVLGDLITLIEPDKRIGQPNGLRLTLPLSGDSFGVPSNLHILGTMNTADRSIALLDTALRRRFEFREMMPDPTLLVGAGQSSGVDLPRLLETLNARIEYLCSREHQIGHGWFSGCDTRADVDAVMRHRVIPLLAEYFFEDWSKVAAVLGDLPPHEAGFVGGFLRRSLLRPPPGLDDEGAAPRFRWQLRDPDEGFDYSRLVGA